ncbi:MAG TPA: DEAD/DEAH box helicase, partial [Acidimicrobiales bacterium]|nr:DEAD/DEAH box helicase [Acidimicrobiales bacterium]
MTRARFLAELGFEPDDFQLRAMDAIDAGRSVLVAAPTGSGKTVVAEYAVARALDEGGKAFYTTPLKALSNQKYGDLVRRHGPARVGLLTGDNAINGDAPIVVMTTEVVRNMIYAGSPALTGLRYVVLDEVHYLQNAYRGPVWEEVIIHTPPEVDLV